MKRCIERNTLTRRYGYIRNVFVYSVHRELYFTRRKTHNPNARNKTERYCIRETRGAAEGSLNTPVLLPFYNYVKHFFMTIIYLQNLSKPGWHNCRPNSIEEMYRSKVHSTRHYRFRYVVWTIVLKKYKHFDKHTRAVLRLLASRSTKKEWRWRKK